MGMFKDMRDLSKAGKQMKKERRGSQSSVTHIQVVSPALIGQLQPGAQVPVKVDPNDHTQLMFGLAG
ncbi:MAG TPA: hypothetical protein VNL97_07305 [Solirubrobacterales bacterium]|nr:hypothetical protein [Solirubrobacterales bacterium]